MHYIADALYTDAWVKAGFAKLEHYLALWRLFTELYPADAPEEHKERGKSVSIPPGWTPWTLIPCDD